MTNEEITYYKNRILNFIINNSGEYGADDISEIFGFSKRRIQDFVNEFNKQKGYLIKSIKSKYYVKSYPKNFKIIKKTLDMKDFKKCIIYAYIKRECGKSKCISWDRFINNFTKQYFPVTESIVYLERLVRELEDDGYLKKYNGKVFIKENPIDSLNNDEILKLLMYLNIMKNIYPQRLQLHDIFMKVLYKYKSRGKIFNKNVIVYSNKHKISSYDEIVFKYIEDALLKGKFIEFTYKTYKINKVVKTIPKGLIYNEYKDMWYVICGDINDYVYRLDRIIDIEISKEEALFTEFNNNLYSLSIGSSHEVPVEVEVHFEKEEFIYVKLLKYKKIRKTATIIELNDKYILKDMVCGINEFEKWVRGFGKSAICVKPEKLKLKIMENIQLMKERYGL